VGCSDVDFGFCAGVFHDCNGMGMLAYEPSENCVNVLCCCIRVITLFSEYQPRTVTISIVL
jgi:hypothetical protein